MHLGCLSGQEDVQQIQARGMSMEQIAGYLDVFQTGIPCLILSRPCTVSDGIQQLDASQQEQYEAAWRRAADADRLSKMVPASGAASRMFQLLQAARVGDEPGPAAAERLTQDAQAYQALVQFIQHLDQFAFAPALETAASNSGTPLRDLITHGRYQDVLDLLLGPAGLQYHERPKGLIPFHRYADHIRTPLDEHLREAAAYTCNTQRVARVHFTVPSTALHEMQTYVARVQSRYAESIHHQPLSFQVSFSVQKPSTDTIAVDLDNKPFRDAAGRLVFRPGGHGALLENLNELRGDIVFLKNIDNVLPDGLAADMYRYKRLICGYLLQLQDTLFSYLRSLNQNPTNAEVVAEAFAFARTRLSLQPPQGLRHQPMAVQRSYLIQQLNRPLRVCGMVRNTGEPAVDRFGSNMPTAAAPCRLLRRARST